MCFELFHSLSELFTTAYGQALLVKLTLVLVIFVIAALNKLKLTPSLHNEGGVLALRNSIRIESVVALFILIITSYFSTIVGPLDHSM
jgi:putative copper resistance protein D